MVTLLNLFACHFKELAGEDAPALWVNSVTRSMSHQRHLQRLGFAAFIPSVHCRGWAADIETAWYERHNLRETLESVLQHNHNEGLINGIDEGSIWHVCVNPARLGELAS